MLKSINLRTVIRFILVFLMSYITLSIIIKSKYIHKELLTRFNHTMGNIYSDLYNDLRFYFTSKNEPLKIVVEGLGFDLTKPESGNNQNSNFTVVNLKKFKDDLQISYQLNKPTPVIPSLTIDFSIWNFILLPMSFMLSLWIACLILWSVPIKFFFYSSIVLILFTMFRIHICIEYMRLHIYDLENIHKNSLATIILDMLFKMRSIEFIYVSTFIIFLGFAFKGIEQSTSVKA
ncbi:MAG: hypothetical protein ABIO44_06290 [Saprospiraceae bacterium]